MKYTGANAAKRPDTWQDEAVCGNAPECDKQAFTGAFPTREIAQDINRRYCSRCPVRTDCLNWAWDDRAFSGIAGGFAFVGDKAAGKERRVMPIVSVEDK